MIQILGMILSDQIQYCSHCGASVSVMVPQGDNRSRHVCSQCETIHYENPKIVTGCIPVYQDKILLCKRAIQPRLGYWTLPAGFMENGETLEQGARRETIEEACAQLQDVNLYSVYSLPRINQVYVMFRGDLVDENSFGVGEESLETQLFKEQDIPWENIAFRVVNLTLIRYLNERTTGDFTLCNEIID